MSYILGIKFRDYGQIYFFTEPHSAPQSLTESPSGVAGARSGEPVSAAAAHPVPAWAAAHPESANIAVDIADNVSAAAHPESAWVAAHPESADIYVDDMSAAAHPESADIAVNISVDDMSAAVQAEAAAVSPPSLEGEEDEVLEALGPSMCTIAAEGCSIRPGDCVIAETGQGLGIGMVVHVGTSVPAGIAPGELVPILRAATAKDQPAIAENRRLTADAMSHCTAKIRARELEMKLVDVEVLFDKSKFIFYFTAPTRIDFRELVKDLVREYHVRIELRQIGVRHETQMIGAVGNCGMVCCCRRFLRKFAPVTIKMAKEQNLFLNPAKISGICGRLLCCLSFEQDNYDAFHRECPRLGKRYQTKFGDMKILRANMFRNSVIALNANNEEVEFTLDEWQAAEPKRPEGAPAHPGRTQGEKQPRSGDESYAIVSADPDVLVDEDFAGGGAEADDFFTQPRILWGMNSGLDADPETDSEAGPAASFEAHSGANGQPGQPPRPDNSGDDAARNRRKRRRRP